MRVRFLRGTALGGVDNDAYPGDVRDLPSPRAVELISMGRAVALADPGEKPAVDQNTAPAAKAANPARFTRKGK